MTSDLLWGSAKFVDVDGIRTRYFERGEGVPLVLVHGGQYGALESAANWELNADLSHRFRLICVDKLGMGHTENPPSAQDYVMGATVQHLARFLDTVGAYGGWVVGHSRGGYAVAKLALENPDAVAGIGIVSSATLFASPDAVTVYGKWRREAAAFSDSRDRVMHAMRQNSYNEDHITSRIIEAHLEIASMEKTKEAASTMAAGGWRRFKADLAIDQVETLAKIEAGRLSIPTLLIWGYNDESAPVDPIGMSGVHAILGHAESAEAHFFTHVGHYVFRENPRGFADVLTGFITRHS